MPSLHSSWSSDHLSPLRYLQIPSAWPSNRGFLLLTHSLLTTCLLVRSKYPSAKLSSSLALDSLDIPVHTQCPMVHMDLAIRLSNLRLILDHPVLFHPNHATRASRFQKRFSKQKKKNRNKQINSKVLVTYHPLEIANVLICIKVIHAYLLTECTPHYVNHM